MKSYLTPLALAAFALLFFSCDRERSNPIDPQSSVLAEIPATPTGLVAQDDVGRILVGWQPVEEGDLAGYGVYRSGQSNGTYEFVPGDGDSTLLITTGKTTFIDSLDTFGATYFYRVAAVDTVGLISEQSNFVGATVLEDLVPPETPLNLSVVADEDGTDRIIVRWTAPRLDSDGSELSGLAGFVVFRAEGNTGGFVAVDTLAADIQELVDEGLKALTAYAYRVMAFDDVGNNSQLTTAEQTETRGLPVPPSLQASGQIERIELSWGSIDNLDLLGYNVYRSPRSDQGYELLPSVEGSDFTTGKTAYSDSNLTGGQTFFYKIQAVGKNGLFSEISGSAGAEVLADEQAPAAPGNVSAVPGEEDFGRVSITWNAPVSDASGGVLTGVAGYVVYRSEETSTSFVPVGQVQAGTHEFIDEGVKESTTYFYAVTAIDVADNEGPRTSPLEVRTKGPDIVAPQAPQNVSAVPDAADFGQVVVRWSPAVLDADGGELTGLVSYVVFRSEGSVNSFVPVATLGADAREFIDTGLDPLTTYFYTLSALDEADNEGPRAAPVQVRTEGPDRVAPQAPGNVSVVADEVDFGRITVRWSPVIADADGEQLTGLAGYVIFRAEGGGTSFVPVDSVSADIREHVDTGLLALTTYAYRMLAYDESGNESGVSNTAETQTLGVSIPLNVAAVAGIGRIELSWGAVADKDLLGYNVYRSPRSDQGYELLPSVEGSDFTTGHTVYIDSNLVEGQRFFYKVQAVAVNSQFSEMSGFVGATTEGDQTAPEPPRNLSAVPDAAAFGQVLVSWSPVLQEVDGTSVTSLQGYAVFRSKNTNTAFVQVTVVAGDVVQFVDTGLEVATTYFYTVAAIDASGNESVRANPVQVRTEGPDQIAPASPSNLSAVADEVDFGRVVVRWSPSVSDADGTDLTGLVGYVVFRSKGTANSFVPVDTLDAAEREFEDLNLNPLTVYFYTVSALDDTGNESGRANPVEVTTEGPDRVAPASPSNLSAVADEVDFGRVVGTWSPSTQDADGSDLTGLVGYIIFRSEGGTNSFAPVDTLAADAREYVDTGLRALTTYAYRVLAFDEAGNESQVSNTAQTLTRGVPVPGNLAAVGTIGRIELGWGAVEDEDLLGYNVYRSVRSDAGYELLASVEGGDFTTGRTAYVDSNLTGGQQFFYKVQAVASNGQLSELSGFVDATSEDDQTAPEAPGNLSAVPDAVDFGRVVVSWSPSVSDANGGTLTGLTGYVIFRSEGGTSSFVPVDTLAADIREYVDTGLNQLTDYSYTVIAFDETGNESSRANPVAVRTEGPDQVAPATPTNLSAVPDAVDFGRVVVSWSPSVSDANGGTLTGLTGYVIFRSEGGTSSFVPVDTLAADIREYVDTGLNQLTDYSYTVIAFDETGNESSRANPVQVRTEGPDQVAPATPTNLSAVPDAVDFGRVVVNWSPSVSDADGGTLTGLTGYVIFRSEGGTSSFVPVDTLAADIREYVDTGLNQLTDYSYTVIAFDETGNESSRANPVQVRTEGPDQVAPATPTNLSAVPDAVDFGRVVVNWSPSVSDADGGDLTGLSGYVVFRSEGGTSSFVPVDTLAADVREYIDAGLNQLTDYSYTVIAFDETGNESGRANPVAVRTKGPDQVAPATPQNLSAVPDAVDFGRVVVSWSPSVSDADGGNLTGLLGYVVFRSEGGTSSFVPVDTLAADVREYIDAGLNQLTDYSYTVIAFDETGNESGRANPVAVRTEGPDQVAPATPQNLSAVPDAVDFGRVVVSWSPSVSDADGGNLTGLLGYVVFRSKGSINAFVPVDTLAADVRQFTDSGLESLTGYFYTVMAFDETGNESGRANPVQVQTDGPDQVAPAAPADLAATADPSAAQITVSWSPPSRDADGGALTGLALYIVLRSKDDATSFAAIDTVNSTSTSFVDTGLESSTTYFYAVRAIDDTGNSSSRSSSVSAKTAGIDVPTGISAAGDIGQITVSWDASTEEGLFGYNVYRSTRSDQDYARQTGVEGTSYTTGQTAYIDSGLTSGATFFYRISVVTSAGESDQSAFAGSTVDSDTRAPAAPTFVDGEPATGDPEQLSLTWKQPTTDLNGATLTGLSSYLIYRAPDSAGPFELVGTSTTTAFVDTGLTAVKTYYYQIEASDQEGNLSNRSTTVALTTGGVDIPSNVRLSSSTPSNIAEAPTVTVSWDASAGAILDYEVQRTTVAGSSTDSDFTTIGTNTLDTFRDDNTVSRGTTYYYRVRARDVDDRLSDWTALQTVDVKN